MNKYHLKLERILAKGKVQENKKGNITYLTNEVLELKPIDLLELFEGRNMPRKKLKDELQLFIAGERRTEAYREAGVTWWDYVGPIMINTYPTYLEQLPPLIKRINMEKRTSKNYVLFLGANNAESSQQPCLSLIQFQIDKGKLVLTAYQRSSDASLGLPSDIYHLYLISREIDVPLKSITLFLGNVHVYENNIEATRALLAGKEASFTLNV
jgi:thymidylate synthase